MREAWPDRGEGSCEKLEGVNPPAPFPMWLLAIDFVRVRGRSNTCYRVGWERVEGAGEEEEDRVGVLVGWMDEEGGGMNRRRRTTLYELA